ncbi:MAG: PPC domain-containing protein, partial [Planctomycetota bacterium]
PVKATICWTDPAGTPVAASLDPPDLMLVNDLDLRVIGPDSTVYSPWILSPGNPAAAAARGDNFRDNVEVVAIDAPDPGIYTFRVTHKGTLTNGSQDFALIISGADGAGCPPGEIADCNGNCAPAAWLGDATCDDGLNMYGGVPIDFSCAAFNYDGGDCPAPDIPFILFRHRTSGRNALWFMDGAARRAETGLLLTVGGSWTVVGSGDFDADGNADLLWRNLSNGKNQIWFMDGTSLTPDIQVMSTVSAARRTFCSATGPADATRCGSWTARPCGPRRASCSPSGAAGRSSGAATSMPTETRTSCGATLPTARTRSGSWTGHRSHPTSRSCPR